MSQALSHVFYFPPRITPAEAQRSGDMVREVRDRFAMPDEAYVLIRRLHGRVIFRLLATAWRYRRPSGSRHDYFAGEEWVPTKDEAKELLAAVYVILEQYAVPRSWRQAFLKVITVQAHLQAHKIVAKRQWAGTSRLKGETN